MSGTAVRLGREIALDPRLSTLERLYARLFGVPILGLRIRARHVLPVIARLRREEIHRIADAGSGRGALTFALARSFPAAEVVGMDINEDQIAINNGISRQIGARNCRFTLQDVTRIPAGAGFDLILSTDNLEHLEDDEAQCGVFFRALTPGGRLLIHVPHLTRNVFGRRRQNFMEIEGHVRPGYTRSGLTSMLERAGLAIVESFYSYSSFETLASDWSFAITGGHERRRILYSAAFPLLLALSQLGRLSTPREGSGVVALARRP